MVDNASVVELIRRRAVDRSIRGQRDDNAHLALVIEGGGMRGVVAGGMVTGLERRGLVTCFDTIHGSSAGACAGAYFAAGQAALGTRIFFEDINNAKFINLLRPMTFGPIMDARFLIDHIMRHVKILDVDKIIRAPGLLHVVITRARDNSPVIFDRFTSADDFFLKLLASISMPIIAGKGVPIDGELHFDGGMTQQIAIPSALAVGATHVLVLMTRRLDELQRPMSERRFSVEDLALQAVYGRAVVEQYRRRNATINQVVRDVLGRSLTHEGRSIAVDFVVRPSDAVDVQRLTKDAPMLRAAAEESAAAVDRLLARP